ncbi:MAG: ABC transporter ATP-binding protein [Pseudomonadota bacterium]
MQPAPDIQITGGASIGDHTLFDRLAVTLESGQWTCLLGGSGVGKSTILRLIAGLDTGAAFLGSISASDGAPVIPRVAYMAQDDLLLPWASVTDNIALGARLRGDRVDRTRLETLMQRVRLSEHAHKKPSALSGGQRQRVALARTLMEDRAIILLDEPFSALDARTRAEMQELAAELLKGRTVLLVTHDPGEAARLGHKIIVMTPAGLTPVDPPASTMPRAVDDAAMLKAQGALLRLLREPEA